MRGPSATAPLAILLLGALGAACGGASQPAAKPASTTAAVTGRQIYAQRCAVCHGAQGQGGAGARLAGGAVTRRFPNAQDEERIVREGAANGTMPPFSTVLTPEQIAAVVAYTRSL